MAGIHFIVRLLLISVAVASAQAFLAHRGDANDIYDISGETSSVVKRMPDLSINQDLKTLANMLLMREYAHVAEMQRNRQLMTDLGKRSADYSSQSAAWDDDGVAGSKSGYGLEEQGDLNESWKEDSDDEKYEAGSSSRRKPSLTLWRILSSS